MRARTHGPFLLLATTLAAASGGCDGVIGDGDAPNGPTPTAECSPTADPIRRLTPTEYVNTATTLFPGVVLPTASPIPDSRVHGFTNQSAGQSISDLGVQRYEELAVAIGEAAAQQLDSWAPCSDDSDACAESLAKELAFRAYRRPLAPDEEAAVTGFALQARGDFGMTEGMAIVIQGLLESPSFLFRPEIGTSAEEGATVPLDGYEMASRLSYFFLDTMPDDGLFAAAADGRLTTPEGVEVEARRLMAMPESRQVLTGFLGEWLGLYRLEALSLDSQVFPELDDQLRADLEASARAFLDKASGTTTPSRASTTGASAS